MNLVRNSMSLSQINLKVLIEKNVKARSKSFSNYFLLKVIIHIEHSYCLDSQIVEVKIISNMELRNRCSYNCVTFLFAGNIISIQSQDCSCSVSEAAVNHSNCI